MAHRKDLCGPSSPHAARVLEAVVKTADEPAEDDAAGDSAPAGNPAPEEKPLSTLPPAPAAEKPQDG